MDDLDPQELIDESGLVFDVKFDPNNDLDGNFEDGLKSEANVIRKPFNLDKISHKCEKLTSDGGVLKLLTKRGIGEVVPKGSSVLFKYTAYSESSEKPFTTCKIPVTIDLGTSTLRGINIALASMRKAEQASFYMYPHYAYGKVGCYEISVPPNSMCLFMIEMVDFEARGGVGEYFDLPTAEKEGIPLQTVMAVASIKKKEAERRFGSKEYERAASIYGRLVADLSRHEPEEEKEKLDHAKMLLKLSCNLALCHFHMEEMDSCLSVATKALTLDPNYPKALYFKAKALFALGRVEEAGEVMLKAQQLRPKDKHINRQLAVIDKALGEVKKDQKKFFEKMIGVKQVEKAEEEDECGLSEELKENLLQKFK